MICKHRTHIVAALAGLLGCLSQPLTAALTSLPEDGWVNWQVQSIDSAPNWCCMDYRHGTVRPKTCDLDSRHHSFGSSDQFPPGNDMLTVYVQMQDGKPEMIRAFSATCPVIAETPIQDLGNQSPADSVKWLKTHLADSHSSNNDALPAIAMHAGTTAQRVMDKLARTGATGKQREDAIFWLGQLRAASSAELLKDLLFNDGSPDIRKHTAFAVAESDLADRGKLLAQLGSNDQHPDVRGEAWFWLSQTKASETETAITTALQYEPDRDVQEQAVFALSQLPEQRAVTALGKLVDDQQQPLFIRKQALFWLGQSESEEAVAYLDRLLNIE